MKVKLQIHSPKILKKLFFFLHFCKDAYKMEQLVFQFGGIQHHLATKSLNILLIAHTYILKTLLFCFLSPQCVIFCTV